jgi:hypothetical protein
LCFKSSLFFHFLGITSNHLNIPETSFCVVMVSFYSDFTSDLLSPLQSSVISLYTCSKNCEKRLLASSYLFARTEQLCAHWTEFREIWYLSICGISLNKIQVSSKSDKSKGYFIGRSMYIYDNISPNSSQNEKSFRQNLYRKSKHTFHVQKLFP